MGRREASDAESRGAGGQAPANVRRLLRRLTRAVLLGGAVTLATRRGVRDRLLDALFGPEEEFEYESQTEPASIGITPLQEAAPAEGVPEAGGEPGGFRSEMADPESEIAVPAFGSRLGESDATPEEPLVETPAEPGEEPHAFAPFAPAPDVAPGADAASETPVISLYEREHVVEIVREPGAPEPAGAEYEPEPQASADAGAGAASEPYASGPYAPEPEAYAPEAAAREPGVSEPYAPETLAPKPYSSEPSAPEPAAEGATGWSPPPDTSPGSGG